MRTVNIGTLKNQLSAYLQYVRNGEEVIVRDRKRPVARILPFEPPDLTDEDALLVSAGIIKPPKEEIDWKAFWALPAADVPHDVAVQAVIDSRGDR